MIYQCDYHNISRSQRATEIARGEGSMGTWNYEKAGCYRCEGTNVRCRLYSAKLKIKHTGISN